MSWQQTITPNTGVTGWRGYCLKYVDDAIGAPARTPTAKIAYQNEANAGRINTGDSPVGITVIGFLSFTVGDYTDQGHVFFMMNNGGNYTILDSETAAHARKPYQSITELLAWFGAYKPQYLGWSTSCDGQTIAVKEDTNAMNDEAAKDLWRMGLFREPENDQVWRPWQGKPADQGMQAFMNSDEWKMYRDRVNKWNEVVADRDRFASDAAQRQTTIDAQTVALATANDQINELKAQLASQSDDTKNLNSTGVALQWLIKRLGLSK